MSRAGQPWFHRSSVLQSSVHPALYVLLCAALTCAWSCAPPAYPPPPQVVLPSEPDAPLSPDSGRELLLEMSDPRADSRILGDIAPEISGGEWRFTGAHPRFRLLVPPAGTLNFYVRFFLHEQSLRARGPVSFKITLNGNFFQTYRFTQAGDMEYRRPIPESWIMAPGPVNIALDVDPPWRLPDGTTVGVLLHSIGFEKREN